MQSFNTEAWPDLVTLALILIHRTFQLSAYCYMTSHYLHIVIWLPSSKCNLLPLCCNQTAQIMGLSVPVLLIYLSNLSEQVHILLQNPSPKQCLQGHYQTSIKHFFDSQIFFFRSYHALRVHTYVLVSMDSPIRLNTFLNLMFPLAASVVYNLGLFSCRRESLISSVSPI